MGKRSGMLAAVGALVSLLGAGYYWLLRRPLPQTKGTLRLRGLHAPVEIIRDRWGVPHIYADNACDLMFAQGFVHAQDRLWQMDFNRRLVAGRLSEVLGAVTAPVDCWMRTLSMRRIAEQEVDLVGGEARAELEAYAAGVNARIGQGRLPIEFTLLRYAPEPWGLADSLAWIKMMSWSLSVNWEAELLRAQLIARLGPEQAAQLEPDYVENWPRIAPSDLLNLSNVSGAVLERASAARPFTGPLATAGLGSNNWVIAGSRTTTGKPLLANDMHLLISMPSIWYENHLVGGDLNVTGVTFPGIPGVVAGHNEHVAWGFTNGFPDVQDLYMEHLRRTTDGRVEYEYKGEWLEAQVIPEEIHIKGKATVTQQVIITRHGPIINALAPDLAGEQPLALRWTSLDPAPMISALRAMNRARNCLEFREALRGWIAPIQNTVYADSAGNIGYSFPGRVPIRAKGNGRVPVPGWTGEYEWIGYIPYEELPHLYNPPRGYIVTANNRVTTDDYAYFIGYDHCSGDRAQRITELIEARDKIDVAYIQQMQFDQVSPTARVIAGYIGQLETDDAELLSVVEQMKKWDGSLSANSPEATIYELFAQRMIHLTLADKLGDLTIRYTGKGPTPLLAEGTMFGERSLEWLQKTLAEPASPWFDLGGGETRDDLMRMALRETLDLLKAKLGPNPSDWAWGRVHRLTYTHMLGRARLLDRLFNRGPYPIGGDSNTVWAAGFGHRDLSSLQDVGQAGLVGPPFRLIADVGDWRNSVKLLTPGQSGQPGSKHYADQAEAWLTGDYQALLFARADIEREAESILRLTPA